MILLRKGKEKDLIVIQEIAKITWRSTYSGILSQKQIDYMLEKMYNQGVLMEQLLAGYDFLIAEIDAKDVAFASYSRLGDREDAYKLHKLYVLPEAHGMGVGKLLINEVLDKVKEAGGKSLELNVLRANKSVEFYKKAGFIIKETVSLDVGNGFFMEDYVMEKTI